MLQGKKIVVVMPAYNAEKTLRKTYAAIPHDIVDEVILTDDKSSDETVRVAKEELNLNVFVHETNKGYGGNQKTCYKAALDVGGDVIVMLHPDYQYNPRLITAMASLVAEGIYDVVLGSRILGRGALKGGMPLYKYIANRFLTLTENILIGKKLSEYHTGYRVFSSTVLKELPLLENSDDFVFDNEMLLQAFYFGYKIGEVSCPTVYSEESSSINFSRSVVYGFGVLWTGFRYMMSKWGISSFSLFEEKGRKIGT